MLILGGQWGDRCWYGGNGYRSEFPVSLGTAISPPEPPLYLGTLSSFSTHDSLFPFPRPKDPPFPVSSTAYI